MMEHYYINKIPQNTDPGIDIIIQSIWSPGEPIEISILSTSSTHSGYYGTFLPEALEKTAKSLEIPLNDFLQETKSALTTHNGFHGFYYQLDINKNEFIWRKQKSEKLKLIYGRLKLETKENLLIDVLCQSIQANIKQKEHFKEIFSSITQMESDKISILASYEECIEEKNSKETVLLTKFIELLNTKKDKIKELEEQLIESEQKLKDALTNRGSSKILAHSSRDHDTDETIMDGLEGESDEEYAESQKEQSQLSRSGSSQSLILVPKRKKIEYSGAEDIQPSTSSQKQRATEDLVETDVDHLYVCDTQELINKM